MTLNIFSFVLGAVFGSFGNVLIYRLPEGKSIGGRSRCPHCKRALGIIDLVPVLSFVVLGARCRTCRKNISWQYPLVEFVSGLLFLWTLHREFTSMEAFSGYWFLQAALLALCLWLLLLIAIVDCRTGMIPDALNIPFVLLAFLYSVLWWHVGIWFFPVFVTLVFQGALIGGGFFAVQWLVSRGRWVGSGDVILGTGIGFLLTDPLLVILALGVSYILGAVVASVLLLMGKVTRKSHLPFGPYLVAGTFVTLFWGEQILELLWQ